MTKRISIIGSSSGASTVPGWNDYEFEQFERSFLTEGVIEGIGNAFAVVERAAGANMSVDVGSGRALINITNTNLAHGETYLVYFDSDATENVVVDTADGSNPRKDRVILKVDVTIDPDGNASNVAVIDVLPGTPAGSPTAPATPSNAISLAIIDVPAGDTTIANAQITDDRSYVQVDSNVLQDLSRKAAVDTLLDAIRDNTPFYAVATGSSNAYAMTVSPAQGAYVAGQRFEFKANHNNTGAATLNVNSLGAKAIKKDDGTTDVISGDIVNGQVVQVVYNGTTFQLVSPIGTPLQKEVEVLNTEVSDSSEAGASSTAEVDFDKTYAIAGNSLAVGDVVRIQGWGAFDLKATGGTDTVGLRVYFGSVLLVWIDITSSAGTGATDTEGFYFDFAVQVKTIGATGTVQGAGFISVEPNPALDKTFQCGVANTGNASNDSTIDTTAAITTKASVQFGVSDAANGAKLHNLVVFKLNNP